MEFFFSSAQQRGAHFIFYCIDTKTRLQDIEEEKKEEKKIFYERIKFNLHCTWTIRLTILWIESSEHSNHTKIERMREGVH